MENEYWLQRWREGRTGWHHDEPMPLLLQHWAALGVPRDSCVLVPLCGKTRDMLWLAGQGLRVLGVEISPLAIAAFLADNQLHASTRTDALGTHYGVTNPPGEGRIEIIHGDIFDLTPAVLSQCNAFYDRAATIALPAAVRERLTREVYARLPKATRGLLITLDYEPVDETAGPPYSVDAGEVLGLFAPYYATRQLDRRDILASQPSFKNGGVSRLHTGVYGLTRR